MNKSEVKSDKELDILTEPTKFITVKIDIYEEFKEGHNYKKRSRRWANGLQHQEARTIFAEKLET